MVMDHQGVCLPPILELSEHDEKGFGVISIFLGDVCLVLTLVQVSLVSY
jgi:hypothetical protein